MAVTVRRRSVMRAGIAATLGGGLGRAALGAPADPLWQALRDGGAAAVFRHARAPGTFDPPGFRLDDCATQRNLSDEGRAQARAIGAAFRRQGIVVARTLSSRWCRCLETARLAFGAVEPEPAFDSFVGDRSAAPDRTAGARRALLAALDAAAARRPPASVVAVTHMVNVEALLGVVLREGDAAVVAGDGDRLRMLGTLPAPAP